MSLKTIAALQSLPEATLKAIEAGCEWLNMPADRRIIDFRQADRHVYFLVEGTAEVARKAHGGRIMDFGELYAGEMFGLIAAVDGKGRSAAVVAQTPCYLARMDGDAFIALLQREPTVMLAVLRHLSGLVRTLTARCFELSTVAVQGRLLAELLRLALDGEISGDTAFVRRLPNRKELAGRIATAREVVSRNMQRLHQLGVIQLVGTSSIRVPSIARLDAMVREALGDIEEPAPVSPPALRPEPAKKATRTPRRPRR